MAETKAELVRQGFEAAARGDVGAVAALLDADVYWGAEGGGGCRNREQALRWMSDGIARGIEMRLLETRELPDGRVLVLLQRSAADGETEPPLPHAQIVSFCDEKIAEMLVYPTAEEALVAAGAG